MLFPIVLILGLTGIVVGILNSYEHFSVPALSPVLWNVAIIVGLVIGVPKADTIDAQLYVYAFSILIATVCSSSCRCRGCAAATTGCTSSSTGATRRSRGRSS